MNKPNKPQSAPDPLALSVVETAMLMGVCRSKVYELINEGELPARKVGARTLILREDIVCYLAALPTKVRIQTSVHPIDGREFLTRQVRRLP